MKKYIISLITTITLFSMPVAWPADVQFGYPTDEEIRYLPKYCKAKLRYNNKHPESIKWKSVIGPNYIDVHHYCNALASLVRANRFDNNRGYYLQGVLTELTYMIKAAKPGFVLLPEILVKRGKTFQIQKKMSEALSDYTNAIKLKPSYSPAYAALSDLHRELGEIKKAHDTLERGLKKSPNSKMLKRRLHKLNK